MKFVQKLLDKKPQLVKAYVNAGLHATLFTTKALGIYMKHLILLQGLDPNTVPGLKARREMEEALATAFTYRHESSFDSDFDFSWAHKKWAENHKKLEDLNLSEQQFVATTDLSRVNDVPAQVTEEPVTVGRTGFIKFGDVQPSDLDCVEEDLKVIQQDIQQDRERENQLEEIAKELASDRLKKLEQILSEGVEDADEFPFNPKVDLPALVERGKQLRELSQSIKSHTVKTRRPSKFQGTFKRGK